MVISLEVVLSWKNKKKKEAGKGAVSGQKCGNCLFRCSGTELEQRLGVGRCKRYPPVYVGVGSGNPVRPTIDSEDWCGEWVAG